MATRTRDERLDLRLPGELKAMIERAAALLGQTTSGFILETARRRASKVLKDQAVIELSDRDRDRLLAALDASDAKPNAALRRAAERHKRLIG